MTRGPVSSRHICQASQGIARRYASGDRDIVSTTCWTDASRSPGLAPQADEAPFGGQSDSVEIPKGAARTCRTR